MSDRKFTPAQQQLEDIVSRAKFGWMDSIDFDHELGEANGGNPVFASAENCRDNKECIRHCEAEGSECDYPCYPKEVAVIDADWLRSLAILTKAEGLSPRELLVGQITRVTDNSSCSYEEVIQVLRDQISWFRKARKDEHGD